MLQHLITSLLAFASTNTDDLFILVLFFAAENARKSAIISGQYLGIGVLVTISFIGAHIGNFVDQRYVGLLGFFPIYLALRAMYAYFKTSDAADPEPVDTAAPGALAVAGVAIANGADNIGVYVPLMTTMSGQEKLVMIIVFGCMTFVWCMLASYLASHPIITRQLDRSGHIITPLVLFCLGVFILVDSGTFSLL